MTNYTRKEIATLLEDGPSCDIWYDAKKLGDDSAQDKIDKVQRTMSETARWLNAIENQTMSMQEAIQHLAWRSKEMAETLTDGANADIWYHANDYQDHVAADRIEKTQKAMNLAATILQGISTTNTKEATVKNEPYAQNVTVCEGIATLEDGTTVNLLKIQAAINYAFQETGEIEFMEAADQLSLITQKWQGPHGEWLDGSYIENNEPSTNSKGMGLA